MPDFLYVIALLRDYVWGGIAVVVAILIPALAVLARIINSSRTSDLTRDELRMLKAFNEQAKGNSKAYLSGSLRRTKPRSMSMTSSCSG
jgi:hypothetical protein